MRKIKLFIILSLLTDLFFFNKQIRANTVAPEVHKSCLQAKDYKGCIKANESKSGTQITNRNPYEKCKMNTGRVGILTAYTPDGIYVFGESIDGSLKEGDIVTIPINGCPGETKFYPVIRNGKRTNVRLSFYSKNDPYTEEHTKNILENRKSSILSFHEERIKNGADKVCINTMALKDVEFIEKSAKEFGSQCIVISIDAKVSNGIHKVFSDGLAIYFTGYITKSGLSNFSIYCFSSSS